MLSVFGRKIARGVRESFFAKVGELNDGRNLEVPVIVVNGGYDGARACLTGAVHGDEYNGPAAISRLCRLVDPGRLRGTIIGLPIVNPLAFYAVSRMVTLDYEHFNLNRIWPGDPHGFLSQRLAHAIFQECVLPSTFVIDNHEGGRDLLARYLIVGGTEEARRKTYDRSMRMAKAFGHGIPLYDRLTRPEEIALGRASTLSEAASREGIPTIVPELGGGAMIHEEYVQIAVQGMLNVLKVMEMIDGDLVGQDAEQVVVVSSQWVRPARGGFLTLHQPIGARVASGDRLLSVWDPFGELREEVSAPFDSVILDVRLRASALPGEWAYHCGRLSA
jgi:predicted deacylase